MDAVVHKGSEKPKNNLTRAVVLIEDDATKEWATADWDEDWGWQLDDDSNFGDKEEWKTLAWINLDDVNDALMMAD